MKFVNEANDHEVAMAQSSLDEIIKNATELKTKIGDMEIDLPGWIQNHITNSENYVAQANKGFHKLQEGIEDFEDVITANPNTEPNVLTFGLWNTSNIGTSNVQVPTPDPNFDRDNLGILAAQLGMSREEYMAYYGGGNQSDGTGFQGGADAY
jgi:hypothetical protein